MVDLLFLSPMQIYPILCTKWLPKSWEYMINFVKDVRVNI